MVTLRWEAAWLGNERTYDDAVMQLRHEADSRAARSGTGPEASAHDGSRALGLALGLRAEECV
ncbi:MAG TPA: hypothetical protein VFA70_03025, partial [Dehalococcoidia bacterium]|nr:hypothetical protein [Dehalococcoidia bacterium]